MVDDAAQAARTEPGETRGLLSAADIRALAERLGVRPTKTWGQNFVIDPNTVRKIVRLAGVGADDTVADVLDLARRTPDAALQVQINQRMALSLARVRPRDWPAPLVAALTRDSAPAEPMSADRVRWEHIQRVYELCDRNVSETARRLKMHRRTLQRILAKRSPR